MKNTLPSLTALLAAASATVIEGHRLMPTKRRDGKDHPVGILTDDLKQLWLLRAEKRELVGDIVDNIEAHFEVQRGDHKTYGDKVPDHIEQKFKADIKRLTDQLEEPYREFISADHVFRAGVTLAYSPIAPKEKSVLGIRQGFEVIYRADNARGDQDDPTNSLRLEIGLVQVFEFVLKIRMTPGTSAKEPSQQPAD